MSLGLASPAAEHNIYAVQTSISLPFITATADGPKHIETNLSRAKFEELASDLLDRCRIPVEQALKDANLSVSDINEVILVGGSTRIPAVQVSYRFRPMQAAVCLLTRRIRRGRFSVRMQHARVCNLTALLHRPVVFGSPCEVCVAFIWEHKG